MNALIRIGKECNADVESDSDNMKAVHPGYGFLSENPLFSRMCKENGMKFVGPSYETMTLLSSKRSFLSPLRDV